LKALVSFRINPDQADTFKYVIRTPKCYLYDDATNTQIQECLPNGINLKAYALKNFPSPTPAYLRPQCHQLGKALAQYITGFHHKTKKEVKDWLREKRDAPEPKLYAEIKSNGDMQRIRHMTYYDWLLERIDIFPGFLEEAREVFVKVKEKAAEELKGPPGDLLPIHGDFWTGKLVPVLI
jgi:hypothetical protein